MSDYDYKVLIDDECNNDEYKERVQELAEYACGGANVYLGMSCCGFSYIATCFPDDTDCLMDVYNYDCDDPITSFELADKLVAMARKIYNQRLDIKLRQFVVDVEETVTEYWEKLR